MSIELDRPGGGVAAFVLSLSTLLALEKNGTLADDDLAGIVEQSLAKLKAIVSGYEHQVILAPYPGMKTRIALTAWTKLDAFNDFDDLRLWIPHDFALNARPDLPHPSEEGLRFALGVELQVDHHLIRIVHPPVDLVATHPRPLPPCGVTVEGLLPTIEVRDPMFYSKDRHLDPPLLIRPNPSRLATPLDCLESTVLETTGGGAEAVLEGAVA